MSIEKLINHPHIWRGADSQSPGVVYSTGFKELDRHLPGGGWPTAALTEIILEGYGIGELSLLMPALARLNRPQNPEQAAGWILWVSPPFIPYAPALDRHGVDLTRMLFVHAAQTIAIAFGLWSRLYVPVRVWPYWLGCNLPMRALYGACNSLRKRVVAGPCFFAPKRPFSKGRRRFLDYNC